MSLKRLYNKCSRCKSDKNSNRSPYCRGCGAEYQREYNYQKKKIPAVDIIKLGKMIDRIKQKACYIDFKDIYNIMFFYEAITRDLNEFDTDEDGNPQGGGIQLKLMWDKIQDYHKRNG